MCCLFLLAISRKNCHIFEIQRRTEMITYDEFDKHLGDRVVIHANETHTRYKEIKTCDLRIMKGDNEYITLEKVVLMLNESIKLNNQLVDKCKFLQNEFNRLSVEHNKMVEFIKKQNAVNALVKIGE